MATSIDDNEADGNSYKSFGEMSMVQYTRNVKDYQQGTVKAILPDDFITLMEEDE